LAPGGAKRIPQKRVSQSDGEEIAEKEKFRPRGREVGRQSQNFGKQVNGRGKTGIERE
jgi:hypothetical protein